ncbi:dTDP-4-dehydrorhamnose reductase [Asticcacaulis endophyticus]|uniref:dTDP-4-dehydrorhamnose reductase n=1 Tax=Asticcacaulis endophyticus TaxID=1395890 RepID=A0A918PXT5_9CAUL|nr:dTDP-4-dehydrorhamnose reductase [Asticcacaulis endophyticus]GGZ25732.1 NAD(P)-dependent oxidoreductase [Asticcacaulis endophyticus]
MRIAVTGTGGQVVNALIAAAQSHSDIEIIPIGRPQLDLSRPDSIAPAIIATKPDVVLSAAAYTAVDQAESDTNMAEQINAMAPALLAHTASALNIPLIHLSTDYVFDGLKTGAYDETDTPGPINVYGRTKRAGEQAVLAATGHVVLRTSWLYSPYGHNFVKTMYWLAQTHDEVRVVDDQYGGPTSALDLANALLTVCARLHNDRDPALRGLFHLTAPGSASWADLADAVFTDLAARGMRRPHLIRIPSAQFPTAAQRPPNSRLDCRKISQAYGLALPPWRHSLMTCLDEMMSGEPHRKETA